MLLSLEVWDGGGELWAQAFPVLSSFWEKERESDEHERK